MGKYDYVRVWDGSSWVQPSIMYTRTDSNWSGLGWNDTSTSTRAGFVWDGSSWQRFTRYGTLNYGDKEWYVSASGNGGTMDTGSGANVNQNTFYFWFYCSKDYDGDRLVGQFGNSSQGWRLMWLADGRMQWNTYYEGNTAASYSSNSIKAYNWAVVNPYATSTGTGDATLSFGGIETSINRSWRHQYGGQTMTIGEWGMMYRSEIYLRGINGSGESVTTREYINNLSVGEGAQSTGILTLNSNNTVYQDTWYTWD